MPCLWDLVSLSQRQDAILLRRGQQRQRILHVGVDPRNLRLDGRADRALDRDELLGRHGRRPLQQRIPQIRQPLPGLVVGGDEEQLPRPLVPRKGDDGVEHEHGAQLGGGDIPDPNCARRVVEPCGQEGGGRVKGDV